MAYHTFGTVEHVAARVHDEKRYPDFPFPEVYTAELFHTNGVRTEMTFNAHANPEPLDPNMWMDSGIDLNTRLHGSEFNVAGDSATVQSHNKLPKVAIRRSDSGVEFVEKPPIYAVDAEVKILTELATGQRRDSDVVPDIDEGVAVMCIMEAMDISTRNNGEPVEVQYVSAA